MSSTANHSTNHTSAHASSADHSSALDRAFAAVLAECPGDFRASLDRSFTQSGETDAYRSEIVRLHGELAPLSPIEWSLVRDIGVMAVELFRNDRFLTDLIDFSRLEGLREMLRDGLAIPDTHGDRHARLIVDYLAGDPKAVDVVDKALRRMGHTPSILSTVGRAHKAEHIAPIERSIQVIRKARATVLRDLLSVRRTVERASGSPAQAGRAGVAAAGGS